MVYTFNPSTWEVEAGGALITRRAWSTQISRQSELHTETLSQKKKKDRAEECEQTHYNMVENQETTINMAIFLAAAGWSSECSWM